MADGMELIPWQGDKGELNNFITESTQEMDVKWMAVNKNMYLVPADVNSDLRLFSFSHVLFAFTISLTMAVAFPMAHLGFMTFMAGLLGVHARDLYKFERFSSIVKVSRFNGINNNTLKVMALEMNAARGNKEAYQHLLNSYLSNTYIQVNPTMLAQGMGMQQTPGVFTPKTANSLEYLRQAGTGFMAGVREGMSQGSLPRVATGGEELTNNGNFPGPGMNLSKATLSSPRNSQHQSDEEFIQVLLKEDSHYGTLEKLHSSLDRLNADQALVVENCIEEARRSYALLKEARDEAAISHAPRLAESEEKAFRELSTIIFHATDTITEQVSRERLERMQSANSYMREKFKPHGDLTL